MAYDLDTQSAESFSFKLGGNDYTFRYPTTEEVTEAQKLPEGSAEQLAWLYGFIAPVSPSAPPIQDALGKVNIKVLQQFNAMVKKEFSGDEE